MSLEQVVLEQVVQVLGVSKGALHLRLKTDGVPMRPTGAGARGPIDDDVLVQVRDQGLTGPAIAGLLGMNLRTVFRGSGFGD